MVERRSGRSPSVDTRLKEVVGGYFVIEAASMGEAVEWASSLRVGRSTSPRVPAEQLGGLVECGRWWNAWLTTTARNRATGILFRVPPDNLLPDRLPALLAVVYLTSRQRDRPHPCLPRSTPEGCHRAHRRQRSRHRALRRLDSRGLRHELCAD